MKMRFYDFQSNKDLNYIDYEIDLPSYLENEFMMRMLDFFDKLLAEFEARPKIH